MEKIEEGEIPWQAALWDREVCSGLEAGQELWIMGSIEEAADRACSGRKTLKTICCWDRHTSFRELPAGAFLHRKVF